MTQFHDYTIKDIGRETKLPIGYQAIQVHVMYDVKHDLLQDARIVSGGHITEVPKAGSNSVVTSLFSMQIVMLFVELNNMKLCACNIWNVYLEAYTKENVGLFAGPEFGKLDGRTLLISNCLYGFRSSGAR